LGIARRCSIPLEAAAFPVVRLGCRVFKNGWFRSALDQLKLRRAFRRRWTSRSLRDALRLLETVDRILTSAEVPYMAYAGTLLGVQRHGGVIPWDDDLDLCLSGEDLARFLDLRETFRRENIGLVESHSCYKLFWANRRPIGPQARWSWPFIDMFVWDKVGSRIVIRHSGDHYPYASIYPLRRAPFHHLQLPVPREVPPVLAAWFGPGFMSSAISPAYNHRREKLEPRRQIISRYPLPRSKTLFSRRTRPQRLLNEMLLRAAVDFLGKCGIEFWIDFGTLLGQSRGDGLLPHEQDVDLSVMEEAYPVLKAQLRRLDRDYEFYDTSYRHDGPKCGITHRRFGGNCDFYTYRRLEDGSLRVCLGPDWRGTLDARDIPDDFIFPLERVRMQGLPVLRPHRTREYLEHRYGYIDHPAVARDDGSGHYRSIWKQDPWQEEQS
jgi:lipopolysaccharide cholinephosphotransferase